MNTWTLIILFVVSGLVKSANIDVAPGFLSEKSCIEAGNAILEASDYKKLTFVCVPTWVEGIEGQ